jgi:hypothetical protein
MSNPEILAMLDARKPGEEVRVSMSKAGVFLTVGEASSETQWKLDDARRDHARLTAEIPRLEEQVERERRYIAEYVHSIIKEGTNRPAPKCPVEARQ